MEAGNTWMVLLGLSAFVLTFTQGVELTFELPDNAKECFFEDIEKGTHFNVEYQVRISKCTLGRCT